MKRILSLAVLAFVVVVVTATGCQSGTSSSEEQEIEIRPAPIHEVDVRIAESYPPQVFIYIRGGLSDGCTTFHELTRERSGNTINITVTTQRPKKAICTQVYGFFEKNVALSTDFTSGETYIINVNDETTSFVMQ
jgi:inhibitor of cysteine peptidase